MRVLTVIAFLLALPGTGCVLVSPHPARQRSAASSGNCPPGHMWSDGRCHSRGKGHDPAKHAR